MAGYGTHALAIAFVYYGVASNRDLAINLGLAIERAIGNVMIMTAAGVDYWDALVHSLKEEKQKDRDDFGKLGKIGKEYGKTLEEVRDAIYKNKKNYRPDVKNLSDDEIREILEDL